MKKNSRVVVIGAGLGGLSAAISLRAAGYEVTVLEKNERIGGKLNVMEEGGYTFDLGPSIFTLPQFFEDLFERAGVKMADYVELQKVVPHWRNFFEDNSWVDLYEEEDLMKGEMAKLTGDPETNWQELQGFLDYARKQYDIVDGGYFREGLDNLWEFVKHYNLRLFTGEIDYKNTMAQSIEERLSDPKMRLIFEYFIKYVGSSALKSPGYMNLMPIIQFDYGLWYVKGGMYELAKGLGKLMGEMGIDIRLGADVAEIVKADRVVQGVKLADGEVFEADVVVSNMEVIPTYEKLLGEDEKFLKPFKKKFEPACSGIVLHLGTDRVHEKLAHHNFFFSEDQHKHFKTVFEKREIPEDPTLYVVAPTRTDPTKAPVGGDNIKILPHIPAMADGHPRYTKPAYEELAERCIDKMERCGIKGLRDSIVVRDLLTPYDIQRMYRSTRGSIYGVETDWKKNYGFKAPKVSGKYEGLYFCGGSTNPGGGMPMVVLSGQKVADRVMKKQPLGS